VRPRTAAGTVLEIEKETYFYRGNVVVCSAAKVRAIGAGAICPPSLMIELRKLMGM
jgi:hypothetical protein